MRIREITEGVGRITKQNQTVDVGPDEVTKQAAKFGNTVDKDGRPPTLSKKVKGSKTNVLYNLGLAEGYKLQLERDRELLVLNITDTKTGKRTEVRGKTGYESGNYDPEDSLHILLDKIGKSANISELINGEVVTINPKHPGAAKAKAATDRAYNEAFDTQVDWVNEPGPNGSTVYAAKIDDAYIEITYKPMNKGVYISFTRGGVMSVTGEGSQNKIFGAVINHIKKWVDKNKPQEIYFSAFKPRTGAFGSQDSTRSGLYRKMVQRFANQNGYDYDVEDTGNEDTFILKRQSTDTQTTEALDQPYPFRWSVKNDDLWYGHAKEDDFYNQIGIEIKDSTNSGRWTIRFNVGDKMDKTGEGDQFKIFATVKAAVQEWWKWASKNAQVNQITFSAEKIVDSSRSKLYQRFAQQFARAIGYEMEVVSGRATDIFYIKKPGLEENFEQGVAEGRVQYKEIEFVCANPEFCDATDPVKQRQLYKALTKISGVIALYQDQSEYSEGQMSLSAIFKDPQVKKQILQTAKQFGVAVDLEQPVDDDYVDRAIRGEHYGQIQSVAENFADGKKPGRKGLAKRSGVNTKASVSSLRKTAKNSSGEKQRMAHWLANMKAGKAKKK